MLDGNGREPEEESVTITSNDTTQPSTTKAHIVHTNMAQHKSVSTTGRLSSSINHHKLSEDSKSLLEMLGKFCIRVKHSTVETVNHFNESEAANLFREISRQLTSGEYEALTNGWSDYRLYGDDATLNEAVEVITHRIQEQTETY